MNYNDDGVIYSRRIYDDAKEYGVSPRDVFLIYRGRRSELSPELQKKIKDASLKSWAASLDMKDRVKLEEILSITIENRDKHNARLEELLTTINESLAKAAKPSSKKPRSRRVLGNTIDSDIVFIGALNKHHIYENDNCHNFEPIGCRELAKKTEVATSTASRFFKKEFESYKKYKISCKNGKISQSLKLLNKDVAPHLLLGKKADEIAGQPASDK